MSITPLSVFMCTSRSSCFFFLRYTSCSDLCLTFVFWILQVFCSFCALVMFLYFSDLPLLCLPSCFFGHFCLETYVRITGFSCACDHVSNHFVTVIVRLGTGVMCKCTCVNGISCELLPNQHIRPLCHSRVFSRDDPACSRCGSGVLYWMGDGTVYLLSVVLLLYLAKQLPKFWCVDNFGFIYCRLWIALQYCL